MIILEAALKYDEISTTYLSSCIPCCHLIPSPCIRMSFLISTKANSSDLKLSLLNRSKKFQNMFFSWFGTEDRLHVTFDLPKLRSRILESYGQACETLVRLTTFSQPIKSPQFYVAFVGPLRHRRPPNTFSNHTGASDCLQRLVPNQRSPIEITRH